jgi:hypothetical protein
VYQGCGGLAGAGLLAGLVASFHAQHAADQQAKLDALLLEAIAALPAGRPRSLPATSAAPRRESR